MSSGKEWSIQKKKFKRIYGYLKAKHPDWREERLYAIAKNMVNKNTETKRGHVFPKNMRPDDAQTQSLPGNE